MSSTRPAPVPAGPKGPAANGHGAAAANANANAAAAAPAPATAAVSAPAPEAFNLRAARVDDVAALVGLIRELAAFEQLSHLVQVTPESLRPHLFGERPVAEAMVAEVGGRVVAFALFFTNFSTFLGKPGLYLEDLYVQPAQRQLGIGRALLTRLARLALDRGCGRFEWSVLDWNDNAIAFYERLGASVLPDWRICRLTGDALQAAAATR